nr:uncharacterized protein LOC112027445 [Quercus suber]
MVDGVLSSDPAAIADYISQFYRQLYSEDVAHRPILGDVDFSSISVEDASWLDRPFEEEEVFGVIDDFNGDKAVFEKSLNASFLALIPKKVDAVEVKDFRPISLVGGIYKIISRVLANRLRRVAHGLILRCGFSEKLRKWIRYCISTVKFSILINGSPFDFFGSSRGFRQGDPLSPLLFDIVMKALSHMLDVAASAGQFSSFSIANLRAILARFEEVSGLRINLGKSQLVPVGGVHNLEALVGLLGCGQSSLPLKYLGLPLGAKYKDLSVWNPILERMERRLAG